MLRLYGEFVVFELRSAIFVFGAGFSFRAHPERKIGVKNRRRFSGLCAIAIRLTSAVDSLHQCLSAKSEHCSFVEELGFQSKLKQQAIECSIIVSSRSLHSLIWSIPSLIPTTRAYFRHPVSLIGNFCNWKMWWRCIPFFSIFVLFCLSLLLLCITCARYCIVFRKASKINAKLMPTSNVAAEFKILMLDLKIISKNAELPNQHFHCHMPFKMRSLCYLAF